MSQKSEDEIVEQFHKLYYSNGGRTWSGNTSWLGYKVLKCPLDLFIYQEIIYETKPDIIIETGTGNAGTTLFLASICDFINYGKVISIDTENTNHESYLPSHKRITYITGLSTSEDTINKVKSLTNEKNKIMVILDSDHHKNHVLSELNIYSSLVTKDNYLVVEDTNLSGHPMPTDFEGPMEAIEEFMKTNQDFIIDESKHKFYLTFNPNGYLKRIYL
jgi:cephalosporin hydroxylase